jgi:glycine cleavage system T protein (aminomethyltransferase)
LTDNPVNRTALFPAHQRLGARLIDFGGWEMPVQYSGIVEEHLAVRHAAGIFDISHMGEVTVSGRAAADFLNHTLTNDLRKLAPGQGQYTLMCNEHGGVIDDLYAYRLSDEVYLLIINASRVRADVAWLQARVAAFPQRGEIQLINSSDHYAAVAVQGPRVKEFINQCVAGGSNCAMRVACVTDLKKNQIGGFPFHGGDVLVSRTGYTGEDGFEIVGRPDSIQQIWDTILAVGQPFGVKPCGLGARDTLRTEVCYPLYGHELDEHTTPIEAGLGFFVSLDKGEFNGRATLAEHKAHGVKKKLVAFKMTDKSAPPRPHYPIMVAQASCLCDERQQHTGETPVPLTIGEVTSGTQSPSLGIGIGLGYVPPELAKPDTKIEIEIRGRRSPALVVARPIYRKT